jgi:hypothetical protein
VHSRVPLLKRFFFTLANAVDKKLHLTTTKKKKKQFCILRRDRRTSTFISKRPNKVIQNGGGKETSDYGSHGP